MKTEQPSPPPTPQPTFRRLHPLRLRCAWIRIPVVLATLAALSFSTVRAQAPAGSIEGRVFNAATGSAVASARVILEGTGREALTDDGGSFRFAGLPAGEVRLSISYLGMERMEAAVVVPATGAVRREFELTLVRATASTGTAVKMDALTVVADREMSTQAIALNERRNAPNIKQVVAFDEFGDRGTENIGEFLRFLPGVSVENNGAEPTTVALRGFPGNNSNINVDGAELSGALYGNSRVVDLREVPTGNISRVEVTKVPTPDMPATGLGGSVNLISRNGFEARRPRLNFSAYGMFHNSTGLSFDPGPRNHTKGTSPDFNQPSFDFSYLRPLNDRFAITVGGSRTWRHKPMERGTDRTDEDSTWDLIRLVQTASQWNSLAQTFYTLSGQIGLDWKISDSDSLSAGVQYRLYDQYVTRSDLAFAFGAGATGDRRHTQGAATGVGTVTMNGAADNYDASSETKQYTLRYRHRGATWRFDANGSYATTGHDRIQLEDGFFNSSPATISNLILRGDDIPSEGGIIFRRIAATTRTGEAVNVLDGANYSIVSASSLTTDWNSKTFGARANAARDFEGRLRYTLKFGAAVDTNQRDLHRYPRTWTFRPNGATDVTSRLAGRFDVFDEAFIQESPDYLGQRVRWISNQKLYQLYQQQPSWFVEDLAQTYQSDVSASRDLSERVTAAYVRNDLRLFSNRLWVVAGVRFERTDVEGSGVLNDINAQYQRNPDGSFVLNAAGQRVLITTDTLALRKLRYVERGSFSKRNYSGWYPSLNSTFNLSENLLLRAAVARTLGRPNVNFIGPGVTISDPGVANPTITVNNTGLLPWTAIGYDLSLESYQVKDGVGSIGVFQKRVRDFFGAVTTPATPELLALYGIEGDASLVNYNLVTRMNVGHATINGIEFGYRQALSFLPNWARGLEVFANATKLKMKGANTADFTGFNPESLSGGVNFVRPRYFIKATLSYQGDIPRAAIAPSATIPAGTFTYEVKQTRIGVTAQYSLNRALAVYLSMADLKARIWHLQRYAPDTPDYAREQRRLNLGYYTNLGIRGTF